MNLKESRNFNHPFYKGHWRACNISEFCSNWSNPVDTSKKAKVLYALVNYLAINLGYAMSSVIIDEHGQRCWLYGHHLPWWLRLFGRAVLQLGAFVEWIDRGKVEPSFTGKHADSSQ